MKALWDNDRFRQTLNVGIWFLCILYSTRIMINGGFTANRLLIMEFIFLCALIIHYKNNKEDKDYLKKIFGWSGSGTRIPQYDYIRVLAVIFVIVTHSVQTDLSADVITDKNLIYIYTLIYWICLACNLLYIMLSGALLLPWREEHVFQFYWKKGLKILLPMIIYFIYSMWQYRELQEISPAVVKNAIVRLYEGDTSESPQYWLIYIILSLYVAVPFLRYMFRNMSYRVATELTAVSLFFMSLEVFLPYTAKVTTFFSSWTGVAVMGYWVTQPETRKFDKYLMGLGATAAAAGAVIIKTGGDFSRLCCNCSPIMCLISLGIFSFIFSRQRIFSRGNALLNFISKYSYSIILVHWWSLHWITRQKYGITLMSAHGLGTVLSSLVTLAASVIAAFLIDNLIVTVFSAFFDFLAKKWNIFIKTQEKTHVWTGNHH